MSRRGRAKSSLQDRQRPQSEFREALRLVELHRLPRPRDRARRARQRPCSGSALARGESRDSLIMRKQQMRDTRPLTLVLFVFPEVGEQFPHKLCERREDRIRLIALGPPDEITTLPRERVLRAARPQRNQVLSRSALDLLCRLAKYGIGTIEQCRTDRLAALSRNARNCFRETELADPCGEVSTRCHTAIFLARRRTRPSRKGLVDRGAASPSNHGAHTLKRNSTAFRHGGTSALGAGRSCPRALCPVSYLPLPSSTMPLSYPMR